MWDRPDRYPIIHALDADDGERALQLLDAVGDRDLTWTVLHADALVRCGRPDAAAAELDAAAAQMDATGVAAAAPERLWATEVAGRILYRRGRFADAAALYRAAALPVGALLDAGLPGARFLLGQSAVLCMTGDLAGAAAAAQAALVAERNLVAPLVRARAHDLIGAALERDGKVADAAAHYQTALVIFEKAAHSVYAARMCLHLAECYWALGAPRPAMHHQQRAFELFTAAGRPAEAAYSVAVGASAALDAGDIRTARHLVCRLDTAAPLWEEAAGAALLEVVRGRLAAADGDLEAGVRLAEAGMLGLQAAGDQALIRSVAGLLAGWYITLSRPDDALRCALLAAARAPGT